MALIIIPLANKNNYYSDKLSGDLRNLYNLCVDNLSRGILSTRMSLRNTNYTQADLEAMSETVGEAIIYGCPELFYIEQQIGMNIFGNEVIVKFANKYEGENLMAMWDKLDTEVNRIVEMLNAISDPYEKIQRINQYLCTRVKYVLSRVGRFGDPYGALILKEARCEGYAKAAKMILDRAGLKSIIAFGEGICGNIRDEHAWNIIEYKSNYYQFDFTWNAARAQYNIPGQEYMFLDDATAHIEHFPKYRYPECLDATETFWAKNNGIVRYHSDLSRINILPFNNNYMAIAKMPEKLTEFELRDDVFNWMIDELAGYNYGEELSYIYNERLNLLIFYFIN